VNLSCCRLSPAELRYWLATAETIKYTTVRGPYKMAVLTSSELEQSPNVMRFLGKHEPYGCYIIKYCVGAFKEPHTDPPNRGSSKHQHERMVCMLQRCDEGGWLYIDGEPCFLLPRDAVIFRPDLEEHEVTPVFGGERIVLTVGKLVEP